MGDKYISLLSSTAIAGEKLQIAGIPVTYFYGTFQVFPPSEERRKYTSDSKYRFDLFLPVGYIDISSTWSITLVTGNLESMNL